MRIRTLLSTLLLIAFAHAALAETFTGTVTNRTTSKPAAGDDVVLLNGAEMKEVEHVKTDASGHFTVKTADTGFYLIRVTHDGANYFTPLQPNSGPVAIEVYTGAAKVDGITLNADVMYIQTDPTGSILSVNELLIEKNDSAPPETLNADRSVIFNLPDGATVEGVSAKSPGGRAVQVGAKPTEQPNQYAVTFPLRPGETQIQVSYRLKYTGSMTFKPRPIVPTDNLVVLMPRAMTFQQVKGTPYVFDDEDPRISVYVGKNVKPSQPLDFTVSGKGQLPRDNVDKNGQSTTAQAGGQLSAQDQADSNKNRDPGVGLANPLDNAAERESWVSKYKWFLIGGIGLLFVAGAGVLLSTGGSGARTAALAEAGPQGSVLDVLRHEMFAVETDRLEGKLTDEQYQELKSAFDIVLRRALARSNTAV